MLKTKEEIEKWLDKMEISNYQINEDLTVDVDGHVDLNYKNLTELPVQFGVVEGNFECKMNKLQNLKGCPESAKNYDFSHNELTTLKGAPEYVNGGFNCSDNNLKDLEHCPKIVGAFLDCRNNKLTSYEHLPIMVTGMFRHDGIEEEGVYPDHSVEYLNDRNDILKAYHALAKVIPEKVKPEFYEENKEKKMIQELGLEPRKENKLNHFKI